MEGADMENMEKAILPDLGSVKSTFLSYRENGMRLARWLGGFTSPLAIDTPRIGNRKATRETTKIHG